MRNYRDYKATDFDLAFAQWIHGINRGVLLPPGLDEQWLISVMHTDADATRYADVFGEFVDELTLDDASSRSGPAALVGVAVDRHGRRPGPAAPGGGGADHQRQPAGGEHDGGDDDDGRECSATAGMTAHPRRVVERREQEHRHDVAEHDGGDGRQRCRTSRCRTRRRPCAGGRRGRAAGRRAPAMAAIGTAQSSVVRIVLEHADLLDRQDDRRQRRRRAGRG